MTSLDEARADCLDAAGTVTKRQRERLDAALAEVARLQAALAVFADEDNWANDIKEFDGTECFVWIGDVHRPAAIAQAALEAPREEGGR